MATNPDELFQAVSQAVEHDPPDGKARGFGSSGLKVGGKLFAMLVQDSLVVKLPRDRVEELVAGGTATRFDPGHGRVMREWASVPASEADGWVGIAEEARSYVGQG